MSTNSPRPSDPALPPGISREWAWHYRALLAARERLQAERSSLARDAAEPALRGVDQTDAAADEGDQEAALALLAHDEKTLVEIEAALERLRRGTYGICEASGRPIPSARLRALPWCRCTLEAEKAREKSRT